MYILISLLLMFMCSTCAKADQIGISSYYGEQFQGKLAANGKKFDMNKLTCASKTLPLNSYVRVTNTSNNKSVVLKVTDRGPYVKGRILDVSKRAAQLLDFIFKGTTKVLIQTIR